MTKLKILVAEPSGVVYMEDGTWNWPF